MEFGGLAVFPDQPFAGQDTAKQLVASQQVAASAKLILHNAGAAGDLPPIGPQRHGQPLVHVLTGASLAALRALPPGESGVDQLVEIIKVLGTPTKEEIHAMNPNYTEFKFPQIKAHPWTKVFSKRMPPDAIDLVSGHLAAWVGRCCCCAAAAAFVKSASPAGALYDVKVLVAAHACRLCGAFADL